MFQKNKHICLILYLGFVHGAIVRADASFDSQQNGAIQIMFQWGEELIVKLTTEQQIGCHANFLRQNLIVRLGVYTGCVCVCVVKLFEFYFFIILKLYWPLPPIFSPRLSKRELAPLTTQNFKQWRFSPVRSISACVLIEVRMLRQV